MLGRQTPCAELSDGLSVILIDSPTIDTSSKGFKGNNCAK